MIVLGINCYHSDSSASLIINGKIVACSEEERFTRIKHAGGFPSNSINFCLKKNNITINDLDIIAVNYNGSYNFKEKFIFAIKKFYYLNYWKLKFEKIKRFKSLFNEFYNYFGLTNKTKILFVPHHLAHNASSVLVSGLDSGLSISLDGSGDFSTGEVYKVSNRSFKLINKVNFPHSLGIFYQAITQFLGFLKYGDEYKVMGLAAYGKNNYKAKFDKIIQYRDGNINLNLEYFKHHKLEEGDITNVSSPILFSDKIFNLLGRPRKAGSKIQKKHKDLAATLQTVFEEIIVEYVNFYQKKFKSQNLFLSGGCFFNSLCNMKLIEKTNFKKIFIQPNAGDAGGSLGAALYGSSLFDKKFKNIKLNHLYYGYEEKKNIKKKMINDYFLDKKKYKVRQFSNLDKMNYFIAKKISKSKIIAWHQGKAEFGPRALGNRSILADPRKIEIKNLLNIKIKNRDKFRPFAPSILDKIVREYFEVSSKYDYDFMNATVMVKNSQHKKIPSVINFDKTARIQIVKKKINSRYYKLIEAFYKITNVPILLNTSLNNQEPISNSCEDSINTFINTKLDYLVIDNYVISRN